MSMLLIFNNQVYCITYIAQFFPCRYFHKYLYIDPDYFVMTAISAYRNLTYRLNYLLRTSEIGTPTTLNFAGQRPPVQPNFIVKALRHFCRQMRHYIFINWQHS